MKAVNRFQWDPMRSISRQRIALPRVFTAIFDYDTASKWWNWLGRERYIRVYELIREYIDNEYIEQNLSPVILFRFQRLMNRIPDNRVSKYSKLGKAWLNLKKSLLMASGHLYNRERSESWTHDLEWVYNPRN